MNNLSVFIPTFNRPAALIRQVEGLLPQLEDVSLTVVDNASEDNMEDLLPSSVCYIRNIVNIGASANLLRCIELCKTDWLWICGDDDPVLPNGIATASKIIQELSDACYVSTTSPLVTYRENCTTSSIPQLLSLVSDIGRLFWITGNLYNVRLLRQYLRFAYHLPSAAPQMVLVFMAMSQGQKAGVSTSSIASHTYPSDPKQRWNEFEVLSYLSGLVDLPIALDDRKAIAASLAKTILSFEEHFLRLLNAVVQETPGVDDLISLFGSRFSRIFIVLDDMENLSRLLAVLKILRDRHECVRILAGLGSGGYRPIELPQRFQRL